MYTEYVEQLITCIKKTQVYDRAGQCISDYEEAINQMVTLFLNTRNKEKHVFFIGNGGSAAIASHMTADFMKNGGMKTCSLLETSVSTCMGNDCGYENIFSRPLESLGEQEDLLVAISSSGNSKNIVNAIEVARSKNIKLLTFSGFDFNNKIRTAGKYNVYVPIAHYGIVESVHNLILQQIVDSIKVMDEEHCK